MPQTELTTEQLRKLIVEEGKRFIKAIEEGQSWESLNEIKERIRGYTQLMDLKTSSGKDSKQRPN